MTFYTATAFAAEAGITYRQVDHWTRRGYLDTAAIEGVPPSGTGNVRIYDGSEVMKARLLKQLLNPALVAEIVSELVANKVSELPFGFKIELTEWTGKA